MSLLVFRTSTSPGPATIWGQDKQISSGLKCGEDIAAGAPVYQGADGLIYNCGGSGITALATAGGTPLGFAAEKAIFAQNGPVTIINNFDFALFDKTGGNSVTPGTLLYIHFATAAKGKYDTVPTFAGQGPVGVVTTAGRAHLFRTQPFAGSAFARLYARIYGEIPTGLLNGSNTTYVLAQTPIAGSVAVYMGATTLTLARIANAAWSLNVGTKTITMGVAPTNTYIMIVDYDRA